MDECRGECSVVSIKYHVHRREHLEGCSGIAQDLRRDDSDPERVECSDTKNSISAIGVKDKVIESELH